MALADARTGSGEPPKVSLLYNPALRSIVYQVVTLVLIVAAIWYAWNNVVQNLARANMTAGFGFLNSRAGFDLAQTLIAYSSDSTYFRALQVGLINTLVIAAAGIVTATIVGLLVGIGRLSHNWLVARLCTVYVEIFRNIPPLLVIFFWYLGVLALLPSIRTIFQHLEENPDAVFFVSQHFGRGCGRVIGLAHVRSRRKLRCRQVMRSASTRAHPRRQSANVVAWAQGADFALSHDGNAKRLNRSLSADFVASRAIAKKRPF